MRAVALSDPLVQKRIAKSFIPLKVELTPGKKELPIDWPALSGWRRAYWLMGAEESRGFTGCAVVSPDVEVEYGNTGGAMVWELFDSVAYDAKKFVAMLDKADERAAEERALRTRFASKPKKLRQQMWQHRLQLGWAMFKEIEIRLPPKGFTVEGAKELFRLSGDLQDQPPKQRKPKSKTRPKTDKRPIV